jgi:MFS family permease
VTPPGSAATTRPPLVRDHVTLALYAAQGVLGFWLNGLGAILVPLRRELDVDRAQVAFYPSLFAVALIVVGVTGGGVVERLGHRTAMLFSLSGMALGAVLLTAPQRGVTLVGALLLGTGSAVSIQVVPAALTRRHRAASAAAIGEANAVSSAASFLAPAAVAAAIAIGVGWRTGYLLPALPVAIGLIALFAVHPRLRGWLSSDTAAVPDPAVAQAPHGPGYGPGALLPRWVDLVLAISAEFCLVFWAADAFEDWHDAGSALAPALATLFLLGMAVVRFGAARLTAGRHPAGIVLACCAVALFGFGLFWASPWLATSALGLLVAGAGIALLYPVTLARLVAAWPHAQDRAAARGALASGMAIGIAPLVLARLADEAGLRAAYLVVPALLLLLVVQAARTLAQTRTSSPA